MKRQFFRAFSLTLAVYLAGIAAAVWFIEPPGAPVDQSVRQPVEYSPDPEEDLIVLGVIRSDPAVVLLAGFFPAREAMAASLLPEDLPLDGQSAGDWLETGGVSGLRQAVEREYSLTVDAVLSGPPSSWQELTRGMGAAVLELEEDTPVDLDGETVILRAGRQRLDSRLSLAVFRDSPAEGSALAAAWCEVLSRSAGALGTGGLFERISGGFDSDLGYDGIARHIQGLEWLGERNASAQAADPRQDGEITRAFVRSTGTTE